MKREDLINTKVYVDGRSAEIQKKLFELGFSWVESGKEVSNTDAPFLYMNRNYAGVPILSYSNNMSAFIAYEGREITVEDILNTPVEPEFKLLQKVLVRDDDSQEWRIQLFSHMCECEEYPYHGLGNSYKQMIRYEGNEHLLNTDHAADIDR